MLFFRKTAIISLLCFAIIMCSFTLFAQQASDIPQLKNQLLDAKTSAEKIILLNKIALAYSKNDFDNTFSYANQAISLAEKVGSLSGRANGYFAQAQYYFNKADGDKALPLYFEAQQLFKKTDDKEEYAKVLTGIGKCYISMTKYEKAITYIEDAVSIYKSLKIERGLVANYNQLGIAYNLIGKKDIAIDYLVSALKINSTLKDQSGLVPLQINIGRLYWEIGQADQAKQYFLAAIQKADEKGDQINKAISLLNLSNIYVDQKQYDKAVSLIEDAALVFDKLALKMGLVSAYNNLGAIKIRQEKYKESIPDLKKALSFTDKNDKTGVVLAQQNIGYAYTMLNNYDEATKWFDLGETEIASGGVTPYAKGELYKNLAFLDSLKGDFKKALDAKNKFYTLSNTQLNDKISKQINEINTKYETSKKEAQISLLNKENDIKALQLSNSSLEISKNKFLLNQQQQQLTINGLELVNKNQIVANQQLDAKQKAQSIKNLEKQTKIQNLEITNRGLALQQRNYTISAILFAFVAVGGFSFSYYKRQQLKQENRLQAEIFKQQEVATKAVFDGEQQERIRIARDLHDSIGQMLSVVKMNLSSSQDSDAPTLQLVDKTIAEVRNISHNLIPEELNFGLFNALEEICDKINTAGDTKVFFEVADEVRQISFTKQNELSIYRIVQEVLGNMIKHAKASEIRMDIERQLNNIVLSIKDNGQGFDTSKINDSKGLGWKNINARVHLLDGKMNVQSERLSGTKIEISIPG